MAFPSTTQLQDDFNRADVNPVSGGSLGPWVNPFGFPSGGMANAKILSNQLVNASAGGSGGSGTGVTWPADFEAYIELSGTLGTGDGMYLWGRCQNIGTDNFSAYGVWYHRFSTGEYELELIRDDAGSDTSLDSTPLNTPVLASGDAIGLSASGTSLSYHYRQSGVWTTQATKTDATYSTGGPMAFFWENGNATNVKIENFYASPYSGQSSGATLGAGGNIQWLNWIG